MLDYQKLVEDKKHVSPGGIDAIFIPISDKWALKMFKWEDTRNLSYDIQKKCSKHKLAPKVGTKVNIEDGDYPYGFICEIVETVIPYDLIVKVKKRNNGGGCWTDEMNEEWDLYEEEAQENGLGELIEAYEDLGFSPEDMHAGNLGYLEVDGERRLICIDFGGWY